MNYLSELRVFHNWQPDNLHDTSAICLWYALMGVANNCGWQEWFTVPVTTLEARTGLSRSAVYSGLNKLVQTERIEIKKRSGRQSALYRLCPLFVRYTDTSQDTTQTQNGTQHVHNPGLLYKTKTPSPKRIPTTTKNARVEDIPTDEDVAASTRLNLAISEIEAAACGVGLPFDGVHYEEANLLLADYPLEWVLAAIKRIADRPAAKKSWGYLKGILRDFKAKGGIDDASRPARNDQAAYSTGRSGDSGKFSHLGVQSV